MNPNNIPLDLQNFIPPDLPNIISPYENYTIPNNFTIPDNANHIPHDNIVNIAYQLKLMLRNNNTTPFAIFEFINEQENHNPDLVERIRNLVCMHSAGANRMDVLDAAVTMIPRIYPWDIWTTAAASYSGSWQCLSYAHQRGCPWDSLTTSYAAFNGHLICLQYAHQNNCEWNFKCCTNAALNGHLECLVYARQNNCEWNHTCCSYASFNGNIICLEYAQANNCPWNENTYIFAIKKGNLNCIQFAFEHNCPSEFVCLHMDRIIEYFNQQISRPCIEYLINTVCPQNNILQQGGYNKKNYKINKKYTDNLHIVALLIIIFFTATLH